MPVKILRLAAIALALACGATAQISILQIRVAEGEGTVHAQGARSVRPLIISISDDRGRPVPGALVTLHVPSEGPGGRFANGLTTQIATADAQGLVKVKAFQANRTAGPFQIRIVASKDRARAGTVSLQYVGPSGPRASGKGRRKWMMLAAVVAGGAVTGGIVVLHGGGPAQTGGPSIPPPPVLTVGAPAISVGKQ